MKELIKGTIGDMGIGYEAKIEDGMLKIAATADFVALISKGESMLPDGPAKQLEVLVLEMIKSSVKSL